MIKKIVIGVVIILVVTLVGIKIFTKSNDKNALKKLKKIFLRIIVNAL